MVQTPKTQVRVPGTDLIREASVCWHPNGRQAPDCSSTTSQDTRLGHPHVLLTRPLSCPRISHNLMGSGAYPPPRALRTKPGLMLGTPHPHLYSACLHHPCKHCSHHLILLLTRLSQLRSSELSAVWQWGWSRLLSRGCPAWVGVAWLSQGPSPGLPWYNSST